MVFDSANVANHTNLTILLAFPQLILQLSIRVSTVQCVLRILQYFHLNFYARLRSSIFCLVAFCPFQICSYRIVNVSAMRVFSLGCWFLLTFSNVKGVTKLLLRWLFWFLCLQFLCFILANVSDVAADYKVSLYLALQSIQCTLGTKNDHVHVGLWVCRMKCISFDTVINFVIN